MKKFFKTKFKKIISIFTAIVILTLVLIIPVSASSYNLFNGSWEQGRLEGAGGVSSAHNYFITSSFINLPIGSYFLSVSDSFLIGYGLFQSNGDVISSNLSFSSNTIQFSTSVDCRIRICLRRTNGTLLSPSAAPDVTLFKSNFNVNSLSDISMVNLSYDELYESSDIRAHSSIENIWYSPDLVDDNFHFLDGRLVLDFSSTFNYVVEVGTYHCVFPFIFKPNGSPNITGSLNDVNYIVTFNNNVSYSSTVTFSQVDYIGGSLFANLEFDINISQASNDIFNNFRLQFDFYNASSDAQSYIYWYGFKESPFIIYNSNFSDASSALDNNSKIEEEITKQPFHNSLSNIATLFEFSIKDLYGYRDSLLAIRQVFDEFFGNFYNSTVAYICLTMSIIVVISRYMRNRRD